MKRMKPLIVLIAVLAWDPADAQSLLQGVGPSGTVRLLPTDAAVLDLQEPRNDLACSVTPSKPGLKFDFLFQAGYQVSIPLKQLDGDENRLTVLLRVRSERHNQEPVYFVQKFRVPEIEDPHGDAFLNGAFRLGEGIYHVDWMMRDSDERVCARFWDVEARVTGKDIPLAHRLPQDLIQPMEATSFTEEDPVERQPIGRALRVKVIVNFAPQSSDAATLGHEDLQGLAAILRKIGGEPNIGSFSIVACSLRAQNVIYRQQDSSRIDLPALGQALRPLNLASVDAKQLAVKNGEAEFLGRLVTEEMEEGHPDGLIFVSPQYPLNLPRETIEHLRGFEHPVFYLNYRLDPYSDTWGDAIGRVVKQLHGFEYTISRPRDLFNAWSDIMSRLLNAKQPAGSMVAEH